VDRAALFVDAGYLLAAGGAIVCGTGQRSHLVVDYARLVDDLTQHVLNHGHLDILRVYWYDGAVNSIPTPDQRIIARIPHVKLRLGRMVQLRNRLQQKGVDSLIVCDLVTLARDRSIATAYLLSGDEDLRAGVAEAQAQGVRVVLLGVPSSANQRQSGVLIDEADEHVVLDRRFWANYISAAPGAAAPASPQSASMAQPPIGGAVAPAASAMAGSATLRPVQGPLPAGAAVAAASAATSTFPTTSAHKPQSTPSSLTAAEGAAREIGAAFATDWAQRATPEEIATLRQARPRIPVTLDAALLREGEKVLGPLRDIQPLRNSLRHGFWDRITAG